MARGKRVATITNSNSVTMAKDIQYERTWCDYLTPCPKDESIEIGSWECSQCPFYHGRGKENTPPTNPDCTSDEYFRRYFVITTGTVKCAYVDDATTQKNNGDNT